MTVGSRIKEARRYLGLSQSELAKKVGLTQATLSDLESDKSKGSSRLASIAHALKVRPYWLETGRGSALADDPDHALPEGAAEEVRAFRIQGDVNGWVTANERCENKNASMSLPAGAYLWQVKGDAYGERVSSGDTLAIVPTPKPEPGDIVAVELTDSRVGLWRLRYIRDEEACFDPLSKLGDSVTVDVGSIQSFAKVAAIILR